LINDKTFSHLIPIFGSGYKNQELIRESNEESWITDSYPVENQSSTLDLKTVIYPPFDEIIG